MKLKQTDWEKKFWQMVEEKGIGSNIRFVQACRDFIAQREAELHLRIKAIEMLKTDLTNHDCKIALGFTCPQEAKNDLIDNILIILDAKEEDRRYS